jgi:hypothetical protein
VKFVPNNQRREMRSWDDAFGHENQLQKKIPAGQLIRRRAPPRGAISLAARLQPGDEDGDYERSNRFNAFWRSCMTILFVGGLPTTTTYCLLPTALCFLPIAFRVSVPRGSTLTPSVRRRARNWSSTSLSSPGETCEPHPQES